MRKTKVLIPRYWVNFVYEDMWNESNLRYEISENFDWDIFFAATIVSSWLWVIISDMRRWVIQYIKGMSAEEKKEVKKEYNKDIKELIWVIEKSMFM